ncbi:IclR family transcriptional regulator [Leucobacter allii]|uniref:IclR family transcriptional regulator n=1 Tax=Leucobacter allii TaxID=2932247 RepID=A0ABY4FME7_9MICO|nr:IclR family transcriptional regulator [Leucobacter allii]UOQ57444.1 IclR family transcriptional regulator [Leucobacter allii]UOR01889.1 IclR family transcriptional regulator [Leucobacter allii]
MDGEGILDRVLRVLDCFSEEEPELGAAELCARTGLPESTMHRLLRGCVERGLLMRAPQHGYAIGMRLWELGEASPVSVRLRETALPHLARLYEATGENVHLAVLHGEAPEAAVALMVGRVTGRQAIPTVSRAGGRNPLHTTGVGKALLAAQDEPWLERYFSAPRARETAHTITDEAELRHDLERARGRGYATTREEMTLGNISVAAALPRIPGLPPAAIGVVVHLARADERRLAAIVLRTARELHAELKRG